MGTVVEFDARVDARIKEGDKEKISKVVAKNRDLYESNSHFVRAAVLRELRRYDGRGRRYPDARSCLKILLN